MKTIEFEGTRHEFPDDFTDADIAKALKSPVVGTAKTKPYEGLLGGARAEIRGPEPLWHRLYSEGLPLVGAGAGAATGAVAGAGPFSIPGGAAGGVLGYAGGRQAVRLIDEVMRRFGQYPYGQAPSAVQTAKEIGKDVVTGVGMEAAGAAAPALKGAGQSLFQRMAGSEAANPARDRVLAAAREQGIPLTIGAESGSRTASAIQRVPELALFGGRAMPEAREATRRGAEGAVERLVAREGGPLSSEAGGAAVQEDIARRLRLQRQRFGERVDLRKEALAARAEAETTAHDAHVAALQAAHDSEVRAYQGRLGQQVDAVGTRMGGEPGVGPRGLGSGVQTGLRETQREARTTSNRLYEEAFAAGDPAASVKLSTTQGVAGRLVDMERRLRGVSKSTVERTAAGLQQASKPPLPADERGELPAALSQRIIEVLGLEKTGTRRLDEVVAIQQRLKAAIRRAPDDVTRRELKQLAEAVTADIDAFGKTSGGAFGSKLAQANTFYRQEVGEDFGRGALLRRALDSPPGQLGKRLLSMTDSDLVGRTMARLPSGQAEQVRRTAFERLVQRATKAGELDPAALDRELSRIAPETRRALFGASEPDLARLQQTLREASPRQARAAELLREAELAAKDASKGRLAALKAEGKALPKSFTEHPDLAATLRLSPDQVVSSLTKGKAGNVGELPRVWRVLTPETKQKVRQSLVQSWLDDARVGGGFSIDRFLTATRKVPDDVRATILHAEPRQALREITSVLERVSRFDKASANPSGTSQALTTTFEVLRAASISADMAVNLAHGSAPSPHEIAGMGALIAGPGLVGKAMTSRWARTLFTPQGLASIPPAQRPAAVLIRLMLTPAAQRLEGGRIGAEPGSRIPEEVTR